jgi:CRP-like cAMP-binding protein
MADSADTTQIRVQRHYERLFAAGQLIFEEGEPGEVLYVIQSGEVELTRAGVEGERVIARLGPGEFFGEMSVVVGEARTARAVALVECRLLELDAETFEAMCVERPEVAIRVIRRLTARLIESERRLSALGIDDLLRPVVRGLVRAAQPAGDDGMHVADSLREIAESAGLSMLEAHRALHQLLDRKLVRLVNDQLVTPDVDVLASCLDAP